MLKLSLCDYGDAYILVSGTITAPSTETVGVPNKRKNVMIKNCALFTDCITEISTTQIDNTKEINVAILMYNSIQYYDIY